MERPGATIDGVRVICWSPIDKRHAVSGSCRTTVDGVLKSPYAGLAIGQRADDPGIYLFYCDEEWKPVTDTYHFGIDRAKEEAETEFRGVGETWTEVA